MAEAHSAVAFSFAVTSEGVTYDINKKALEAVVISSKRSWKKRIARFKNSCYNSIYPFHPSSWFIFVLGVFLASFIGLDVTLHSVDKIEDLFRNYLGLSWFDHVPACLLFSFLLWFAGVQASRFVLKCVLSYQGWLELAPGQKTLAATIWMVLLKAFQSRRLRLYGYQSCLPSLPLPSLHVTLRKYLRSVRGLLADEEYKQLEKKVESFRKQDGRKLQLFLRLKYWLTSNYVTDWWEDYVYLASRGPLMSNSNFYGVDALWGPIGSPTQAARAAVITYYLLQHRRQISRDELKPLLIRGFIPLCSLQYERQFNTTRIPQLNKDRLQHYKDSDHIVVYCRGRYFKCPFCVNGRYLRPVELEAMFNVILRDTSDAAIGETDLAALTAGPRDDWANARQIYFSTGVNKESLDAVEKAAFFIAFDDDTFGNDVNRLSDLGKSALCGNCNNRWFDKSFTLIVYADGKLSANAEHSWADSPVMSQTVELVNLLEFHDNVGKKPHLHYVDGHCDGEAQIVLAPIRLKWSIPEPCLKVIESSLSIARALADNVDLKIINYGSFGKDFMKRCGASPDAFLQVCYQLAYFLDKKRFCLTYESAMTRLFREGRTETVRSCTLESIDFVRGMLDDSISVTEKQALFHRACNYHQVLGREAMAGKGVDRHLFALYVVSKYLKMESPFLKEILSEPWRLSTSQTPMHQSSDLFFPRGHPIVTQLGGGGFGPVVQDGYGISYIFSGEDNVFIHVSSYFSSPETDSSRFLNNICDAFSRVRQLFEPDWKAPTANGIHDSEKPIIT